ncbi:MAG: undecaprenyl-diphosphatase UppP [Chloroflexi bacterium]|nr:undecaprenyl-diphosphatase UppP [Chloroflexota bacterium]
MNSLQAVILGIVQGLTEFLPVSSSGHLVLVPWALEWGQPGLLFDTVLHWGTLVAVVVYFWDDLWSLVRAWVRSVAARKVDTPQARLAWLILIATIPAAVIGYLLEDFFESLFSAPVAVGGSLIGTGLILAAAEWAYPRIRKVQTLRLGDALIVGLAQAAAICPGLSRSGLTIAAGIFRGLGRESAARFSFLLSVPIILGAGLAQLAPAIATPGATAWFPLALGFASAAISGYLAIHFLLGFVRRRRFWPFAAYCWIVGLAALAVSVL